jgi:hypothetical protein
MRIPMQDLPDTVKRQIAMLHAALCLDTDFRGVQVTFDELRDEDPPTVDVRVWPAP